ncbi:50S ribosomal subunit protein L24 [Wigglesworthia glossinidia endosymbiont of Glossina morsitans morsitans (Yale colony)]|uniref:Large ribosomal subunit protein uL24 n=1 Tax=Wigglesworthia glossinidia endosymbiont of Glossina morsitans morsitans (Yale colony) TaxID=1142511 RepID=H6Q4I2_WIGGL|nr:50S ribosomal protein L24 [Wigglesworthia glossinidia]AFA41042.1 50S ribosomal subunit protein L24 [Wigglesworthia glossinidia endosymbiont of Glossina morsitans morsitans (Yale colony)]
MAKKIKINDEVIVRSGKYKGKKGKVKKIIDSKKAIVEGINLVKKNQKPNPNTQQSGGIIEKEQPISLSNLAIFNFDTQKLDRIGFTNKNGIKYRMFKSNKKLIK